MSYEPTNWKAGDTVTSAKLNKMEQGIAGGTNILLVEANSSIVEEEMVIMLNKTWQEIFDADMSLIVEVEEDGKSFDYVTDVYVHQGDYVVSADKGDFTSQTADGYPARRVDR